MDAGRLASGSALFSFFSRTSDWRTASRATARWAAEPKDACSDRSAFTFGLSSSRPSAAFTRRMRRTASSMRAIGTRPSFTRAISVRVNSGYLSGTITMSIPALIEVSTSLW